MKKVIKKLLKLFENPYQTFLISIVGVFFAGLIEYWALRGGLLAVFGFVLFIVSFVSLILSSIFMYLQEKEDKREEREKEEKENEK